MTYNVFGGTLNLAQSIVTNGQRRQNSTCKIRPLTLAERRRPVLITTSPKLRKKQAAIVAITMTTSQRCSVP